MPTEPLLLEVRNLSYFYPERKQFGLDRIHFTLEEGKFMAIVGESGSGKTTLLQLLAGLLDPAEGTILLDGEQVRGPAYHLVPGHPAVKVVFQHFGLSPKLNVYHNIAYVLKAYPLKERQERVQELMRLCKLKGLEENFPYELSGGEKQRLSIARALADAPLLLLMDEPFSNMDVILKNQLREDIIDILQNTGTTAIMVTHDMHDALYVADRIAVMQQGRLIQTGTPMAVYEKPTTPYVAQLFGTCNFLKAGEAKPIVSEVARETQTLCLRAEHIRLVREGESDFCGKIIRKHFMGAYAEFTVQVANLLLVVHANDLDLKEDEQVCLSIDTDRIIYF